MRRVLALAHASPATAPRGAQMRVPCRDRDCGHRICDAWRDAYDEGFADGLAVARDES